MKRQLTGILSLILISVALVYSTPPGECADRCDTVKSLCMGQADLLNELCKAQGGSTQQCLSDFINYYSSCMTNNDCPVNH